MAGLHPEGERHLGSEVPVVLDLVVPDLQLPHAAAQLHILLVLVGLKTREEKNSLCSELSGFFQQLQNEVTLTKSELLWILEDC